jgi:hypothetical protein
MFPQGKQPQEGNMKKALVLYLMIFVCALSVLTGTVKDVAAEQNKSNVQKQSPKQLRRGESDPERIRQVAADMKIGENVKIRLYSGQSLNGKFLSIDDSSVIFKDAKTG